MSKPDEYYMHLAIELGEKAKLIAPPNPWVGAVIVKNDKVVGTGYTHAPGGNHAEINALEEASIQSENSTIYITLEPCSHHGRTPPCVDALIKAKIGRVVIALKDPDTNVSGNGIKALESAGIPYFLGTCKSQAFDSLQPYLHHRSTGKPYVVAKSAISIDGRTAASDGSSKWISNTASRQDAQHLRLNSQAVLIGSGTALKDSPTLNVRGIESEFPIRQPLRVLFDGMGKVLPHGPLFDQSIAKTLVFTSSKCNVKTLEAWKAANIDVHVIDLNDDGRLDITQALIILGKLGVLQLLVEGGSSILTAFLKKQAIDRLILYVSPKILGDTGYPLFKHFSVETIEKAPLLKLSNSTQIGDCMRLDYTVIK